MESMPAKKESDDGGSLGIRAFARDARQRMGAPDPLVQGLGPLAAPLGTLVQTRRMDHEAHPRIEPPRGARGKHATRNRTGGRVAHSGAPLLPAQRRLIPLPPTCPQFFARFTISSSNRANSSPAAFATLGRCINLL